MDNQDLQQNTPQEQPQQEQQAYQPPPVQQEEQQPYQPQQPYYTPQPQHIPPQAPQDTLGKWVGVLFVAGIPVVGIIMLFVWGFGNSAPGIKNYARAALIWKAVAIVISFLFIPFLIGFIGEFSREIMYYM